MADNISRFMDASQADADLAQKVNAVANEAAALVAARLSELSQATAFPFTVQEALAERPMSDNQLEAVTGGAKNYSMREINLGFFTFRYLSPNNMRIGFD